MKSHRVTVSESSWQGLRALANETWSTKELVDIAIAEYVDRHKPFDPHKPERSESDPWPWGL